MIRKLLSILMVFLFYCILGGFVSADRNVKTDYQVQYVLSDTGNAINTKVFFNVKITNVNPEVYVKRFSLNFPESFQITNLKGADDKGPIQPTLTQEAGKTKIDLSFTNPVFGKDTANTFYLEFNQDKLFNKNGNVWEVILPTIADEESTTSYKVIVNLPEGDKKLSIAKPKPDVITGKQIIWTNPTSKTIYAVFGPAQYYDTSLIYTIKNPKLNPVYTEIAFPPDTLYQKVYVKDISPKPAEVYQDEDGNYLGKYYLNPSEEKSISFKGTIQVNSAPFEDIIPVTRTRLERQKKYLLNDNEYWKLNETILNQPQVKALKTPQDIYNFVIDKLSYSYTNVKADNERLGAEGAFIRPDQAVCVEFSDLFVGLAREKGIYAREVEGFGFSQDPQLRPISLLSDVLHSWPEYVDPQTGLWVTVDPTWEDTSGIDYLTSLDLNHIVFAIHGKRPDYPVPAGMYKTSKSQDILIRPSSNVPELAQKLSVTFPGVPKSMHEKKKYTIKVKVQNTGNAFQYNIPLRLAANSLSFPKDSAVIESLAPFEVRELAFDAAVKNGAQGKTTLDVYSDKTRLASQSISISSYYLDLLVKIGIVVFGFLVGILVFKKLRKRKLHHEPT